MNRDRKRIKEIIPSGDHLEFSLVFEGEQEHHRNTWKLVWMASIVHIVNSVYTPSVGIFIP